ncbi:hypothetical protein BJ170DRAFT_291673 [Xylariales sp. AK1849]|nr:hypothetical protein BJ170DRAFT_291673 [Xylariales sp. AK1849]
METSAPKRRKTSPNSNIPVDGSGSDAPASSDTATRHSTTTKHHRPSFASPTKASLARANPDVLDRRNANAHRANRQASAPADWRPTSADSNGDDSEQLTAQLEGASENRPASDPVEPDTANAPPVYAPGSPSRRATGLLGTRPRRSLNPKPSPRPLPPPSDQEEELLDPFKGRALRRSPPRGVLPAPEQPEEPELPPTPTAKGMGDPAAASTSPMGIHHTPSRKPRRSRALAEKMRSGGMSSPPLKQPPLRPVNFGVEEKGGKGSSQTLAKTSRTTSKTTKGSLLQAGDGEGKPHPARGVKEFNPFAGRTTVRNALLDEIAQLESDLETARKENNRLHLLQHSYGETADYQEPEDKPALLDLLRRRVLPPDKEPSPAPSHVWLEAALDPTSFLPFGAPSAAFPNPFAQESTTEEDKKAPPPSHHPVPMGVTEGLPYLQLFTPLEFTSTVTLVSPSPDDARKDDPRPTMQQHTIHVSSSPSGLFNAQVSMLVNTAPPYAISSLSVPRLDPASVAELGPFISQILEGDGAGSNSALKRNISVITWAMAEWTRLATRRARFWCALSREFGSSKSIKRCVERMRKARRGGGGLVGRRRFNDESDADRDSDSDAAAEEDVETKSRSKGRGKWMSSKAELLPVLGRTNFYLDLSLDVDPVSDTGRRGDVGLRIDWRIVLDWTGEGSSKLGVLVQAPGKWHASDDRGSLAAIPDLFDKLVRDGGEPMEALWTAVALAVGEGAGEQRGG